MVRTPSFSTKDGDYTHCVDQLYSRPTRTPYYPAYSISVHVSVGLEDYILFNVGSEAFVYSLAAPGEKVFVKETIDKWNGKSGMIPLCHDINDIAITSDLLPVILGFKTGLIVYYNPLKKKNLAMLNHNPLHDSSSVLELKWQPGEKFIFASAHRSGHLYFWTIDNAGSNVHSTGITPFAGSLEIQDARIKGYPKGNLLQKWGVGHGAINSFSFSPDGLYIAIASQDGFMRVYNVQKREFHGRMRSYFGGFLCVCWSPDGKYVVTGGEDDLVTVWSFEERCVVTRCEGHNSWVNAVAFDPFLYSRRFKPAPPSNVPPHMKKEKERKLQRPKSIVEDLDLIATPAYPLASVGEDGRLLLWDLTADALRLRHPLSRGRSAHLSRNALTEHSDTARQNVGSKDVESTTSQPSSSNEVPESNARTQPQATETPFSSDQNNIDSSNNMREAAGNPNFQLRKHQKSHSTSEAIPVSSNVDVRSSLPIENESKGSKSASTEKEAKVKSKKDGGNMKIQKMMKKVTKKVSLKNQNSHVSSAQLEMYQSDDVAPSMDEVNMLAPRVSVEVSPERLTDIVFTKYTVLVACHHGFVQVWQRPESSRPTSQIGTDK